MQLIEPIFCDNDAIGKVKSDTIDLHGQLVEEAEEIPEQRIRYTKSNGHTHLHMTVSEGNHSSDHVQKIRLRVERLCRKMGLREHNKENEGWIYIDRHDGQQYSAAESVGLPVAGDICALWPANVRDCATRQQAAWQLYRSSEWGVPRLVVSAAAALHNLYMRSSEL